MRGTVHGEVFEISSPQATLAWLDDYEGIGSSISGDDEYVRRLIVAHLQSGESGEVWAYVYQHDIAGGKHLADGRWRGRSEENSRFG